MRPSLIVRLLLVSLLSLAASALPAQIPTPEEFLGYRTGEHFTPQHRILAYFQELDRQSDLLTLRTIGESYEGRPLVVATITSPANHAQLESIRTRVLSLARADRTEPAQAAQISANTPAVVWLGFGIHGNESSSAEAAMQVASLLLRDAQKEQWLEQLVIHIDPLMNPDGRERYAQWFRQTRGLSANAHVETMEHLEPWPGGRFNHYLNDMNRDWTWLSQKETRARVAEYLRWYPQVFADFHEMSYLSSYFFPPVADPINPHVPPEIERWLEVFGRANAEVFSAKGWPFFVGERYDLFYPGYTDTWASLHGAVGMTFEVGGGGRAGLVVNRESDTTLTLADRIERHVATALSTVRTAAQNRQALLRYTYDALRSSVEDGNAKSYLLLPDSPHLPPLVELLRAQDIAVSMIERPVTLRATALTSESVESRTFPAGTAVVSTRQPLGGLVQALLERSTPMPESFLEEQRGKLESDEPEDFADITSWSLPLAMNVTAFVAESLPPQARLQDWPTPAPQPLINGSYGYLISGADPNVYRAAGHLLRERIRFSVAQSELNLGERTHPRGSLVILRSNAGPSLDERMAAVVGASGVVALPLSSGWMGRTTFGSGKLQNVREPRIALVGGPGTFATSFGTLWHTLDVHTPIPHALVTADSLRSIDLNRYNVLLFPDGDYAERLGKRGVERLQQWVRAGGTIVAIKDGAGFLRAKDAEISKVKLWEPPKSDQKEESSEQRHNEVRVPGSAFRTTMSERSHLTMTIPRSPAVLIEGAAAFLPVTPRIDNVVSIVRERPLLSGLAWPDSIARLAGSPYLVHESVGRGNVITFADEPHFRSFWRGTLPLLLNAVLYSPSFTR